MCDNAAKTLGSNHLKHIDRRLHGINAEQKNVRAGLCGEGACPRPAAKQS